MFFDVVSCCWYRLESVLFVFLILLLRLVFVLVIVVLSVVILLSVLFLNSDFCVILLISDWSDLICVFSS